MSRINEVSKLFADTKEDVLKNISNWQDYLTTASKLYKYSFDDQIMIYAQRPDATACANIEIWNKKMNRWVKRGSKGIALIRQNQGGKPRIEYVFEVSDTNEVRGAKTPYLWEMQPNYHEDVLKQLTGSYGEIKKDDFASNLMELTERAVGEHYREFLHDLNYDLEDSFLEGIDELNMDVAFRNAVTTSVQYMVLTRCGIDAREYLDEDDFRGITDFNTPAVFSHLGNAINLVSNEMLLTIGAVIRESERNLLAKSIDNKRKVDYTDNIEFSTLKRESKNIKGENDNGRKGELYSERRLSDTGFTDGGFGESSRYSGQVWNDERNASQGEPQGNLQPNAARRESVAAFGGGGQDSSQSSRTDDRRNDESTGSNRGAESQRSTSLGADDNKHQATIRRSGDEGLDLRKVSGNQVSLFPTIHEQIESIAESKAVSDEVPNGLSVTFAAFSFAQNSLFDAESISFEVVDKILATGGEEKNSTSLIAGYMAFNTDLFENADYLKNHYGRGGKGFEIDGVKYSFWYDEGGISIARGNQTYHAQNKINLSWVQTAERIRNLLEKGEYLTADKLEQSKEVYQKYVAEYFSFMYRDKAEDYTNEKLDPIVTKFVYPDCTEEICTHLTDKEKLSTLMIGLKQMEQDFIADKDATMRITFHTPTEIIGMAKNFQNEPVIFPSKEEFAPITPSFITQDELNAIYATDNRTRHFNTSRIDTYAFFKQGHTEKEKSDFLKNHYGWSGSGHWGISLNHSAKGTIYAREIDFKPYATVMENWGQVTKRIDRLIAENRYLSSAELAYIPTYEKEKIARGIVHFYSYAPSDIEKPFTAPISDYSYMDRAVKEVAEQLEDSEFVDNLIGQMEYVLGHTLSDARGFDYMQKAFANLKDFQTGDYSVFKSQEYAIKRVEKDLEELDEDSIDDITNIAKKLERKRKSTHKETDSEQLTLDLVGSSVSSILEDRGLMVSDELIDFATESLENPTNENIVAKVEEIIKEESRMTEPAQLAYQVGNLYFSIQEVAEGYDYSIFDENFHLINGGVYDDPSISMEQVINRICEDDLVEGISALTDRDNAKEIAYNYLLEQTETQAAEELQVVTAFDENLGDFDEVVETAIVEEIGEKRSRERMEELVSDEKTITEYLNQKTDHPHQIVGIQSGSLLLFYGDDAEITAPILGRKVIERDISLIGNTKVTGGYVADWQVATKNLKDKGINFCFIGEENGEYHTITEHYAKDYIPIGMELTIGGRDFVIDSVNYDFDKVSLRDTTFQNGTGFPIFRSETVDYIRYFVEQKQAQLQEQNISIVTDEKQPEHQTMINFDFGGGSLEDTPFAPFTKQVEKEITDTSPKINYAITNDDLGVGTAKEKYAHNILAIQTLKQLETEKRRANAEEQEILSQYVGWGGLADAFDENKDNWRSEYTELKAILTPDEYEMARASTLNAHYTSPTVIRAIYKALENMDIPNGNILEPAMGSGNFFGMLPQSMQASKLYGVELDSLTGRIAKQLYQKANIQMKGFEKTDFSNNFFDMAVGNVPFGNYKLNDKKYDKLGFLIHDYFFGATRS